MFGEPGWRMEEEGGVSFILHSGEFNIGSQPLRAADGQLGLALAASCGAAISAILSTQSMQRSLTWAVRGCSSPRHDGTFLEISGGRGSHHHQIWADLGRIEQVLGRFRRDLVDLLGEDPEHDRPNERTSSDSSAAGVVPSVPRGHERTTAEQTPILLIQLSSPNQVWHAGHVGHPRCYTGR